MKYVVKQKSECGNIYYYESIGDVDCIALELSSAARYDLHDAVKVRDALTLITGEDEYYIAPVVSK